MKWMHIGECHILGQKEYTTRHHVGSHVFYEIRICQGYKPPDMFSESKWDLWASNAAFMEMKQF